MVTYQEAIDFLYSQLPMFHRIGKEAYKKDLTNTLALCQLLDHPQERFQSIHIAGTNGKGSTSHFLAAILQAAGYKTGLYTSPHLKDFRERIRINGEMIPEAKVLHFVEHMQEAVKEIQPSFFEWTVALAFQHFREEQVDIAVIETGLGGRLDSTNVISPELSIITNIGWDHMDMLGDTLPQIAAEKAGIIKPSVPVIIGQYQEETATVFKQQAVQMQAPLRFASLEWRITRLGNEWNALKADFQSDAAHWDVLSSQLTGTYQLQNIATVLTAVDELRKQGWNLPEKAVRKGIAEVVTLTGLQGRWQMLHNDPVAIADTGHNKDGIEQILANIERVAHRQLHWVLGVVKDKKLDQLFPLLPKTANYYFCNAAIPRAMPAEELAKAAQEAGLNGIIVPDVRTAYTTALSAAQPDDLVIVAGSTFIVAEVL